MSQQEKGIPTPADNSPAGKEARLARLLAREQAKKLSALSERFYPLARNFFPWLYESYDEWETFCEKFAGILNDLLRLNPFGENEALKTECQSVLRLIEKEAKDQETLEDQSEKCSGLIHKIENFFFEKRIFPEEKIPD